MVVNMASISDILEAMDKIMVGIKSVADTPGINLIPYVSTVSGIIGTVHMAYEAGKNITPYISAIKETFDGKAPSEDDLATLNARIAALDTEINAPLPPKEEGEPD